MPREAFNSPDPLVMAVRRALKEIEPRPRPTETTTHDTGFMTFTGWLCPVCGDFCGRDDRQVWRRGQRELIVDYAAYNMHWAHNHSTPFWKEQHIIEVVKKHLA